MEKPLKAQKTQKLQKSQKKYLNSISNALHRGAINHVIIGCILFVFGTLPKMLHYDLFYWPPFLIFTMEYYYFWRIFGGIIVGWGIFGMILEKFYSRWYNRKVLHILFKIIAYTQLVCIPFGTYYGTMILTELREIEKGTSFIHESKENEGEKRDEEDINNERPSETSVNDKEVAINDEERRFYVENRVETSKLIIIAGLFHEAGLVFIYLLTVYMSTVMLDLTFPYFVMETITNIRWIMLVLGVIFGLQILIGYFYQKMWKNKVIRFLSYVFAILQVFILPIGTYVGVSMLKTLRYDVLINNTD